ncbi:MAG: RDD family protein [Candidatus Polarisedimenticolia bacterium]
MIDTQRHVETPEGVDLHLVPAGPMARAEAFLLDSFLRFAVIAVGAMGLAFLEVTGAGLYMLLVFGLSWLYPILFEVLNDGATPGKRALRLKVVHEDGTPVGWTGSIIRNLLRAADCLPVGYAAGFICMLFSNDFRRLGDLAAGTVVVHTEGEALEGIQLTVAPIAPPVALQTSERRAIVDFARRLPALTPERAEEMARLLQPLTGPLDPVGTLQGYAAWIVGRR